MATHLEIGKAGEKLAETYLCERGFTVLHRNWRCGHEEIDLILLKDNLLHFVEVKFRTGNRHTRPEAAVTRKKIKTIHRAIEWFLYQYRQYEDFRLDVLAITELPNKEVAYFFVEDVT